MTMLNPAAAPFTAAGGTPSHQQQPPPPPGRRPAAAVPYSMMGHHPMNIFSEPQLMNVCILCGEEGLHHLTSCPQFSGKEIGICDTFTGTFWTMSRSCWEAAKIQDVMEFVRRVIGIHPGEYDLWTENGRLATEEPSRSCASMMVGPGVRIALARLSRPNSDGLDAPLSAHRVIESALRGSADAETHEFTRDLQRIFTQHLQAGEIRSVFLNAPGFFSGPPTFQVSSGPTSRPAPATGRAKGMAGGAAASTLPSSPPTACVWTSMREGIPPWIAPPRQATRGHQQKHTSGEDESPMRNEDDGGVSAQDPSSVSGKTAASTRIPPARGRLSEQRWTQVAEPWSLNLGAIVRQNEEQPTTPPGQQMPSSVAVANAAASHQVDPHADHPSQGGIKNHVLSGATQASVATSYGCYAPSDNGVMRQDMNRPWTDWMDASNNVASPADDARDGNLSALSETDPAVVVACELTLNNNADRARRNLPIIAIRSATDQPPPPSGPVRTPLGDSSSCPLELLSLASPITVHMTNQQRYGDTQGTKGHQTAIEQASSATIAGLTKKPPPPPPYARQLSTKNTPPPPRSPAKNDVRRLSHAIVDGGIALPPPLSPPVSANAKSSPPPPAATTTSTISIGIDHGGGSTEAVVVVGQQPQQQRNQSLPWAAVVSKLQQPGRDNNSGITSISAALGAAVVLPRQPSTEAAGGVAKIATANEQPQPKHGIPSDSGGGINVSARLRDVMLSQTLGVRTPTTTTTTTKATTPPLPPPPTIGGARSQGCWGLMPLPGGAMLSPSGHPANKSCTTMTVMNGLLLRPSATQPPPSSSLTPQEAFAAATPPPFPTDEDDVAAVPISAVGHFINMDEPVRRACTVVVKFVATQLSPEDLGDLLREAGPIIRVRLAQPKTAEQFRCCFVEYFAPASAKAFAQAYDRYNGGATGLRFKVEMAKNLILFECPSDAIVSDESIIVAESTWPWQRYDDERNLLPPFHPSAEFVTRIVGIHKAQFYSDPTVVSLRQRLAVARQQLWEERQHHHRRGLPFLLGPFLPYQQPNSVVAVGMGASSRLSRSSSASGAGGPTTEPPLACDREVIKLTMELAVHTSSVYAASRDDRAFWLSDWHLTRLVVSTQPPTALLIRSPHVSQAILLLVALYAVQGNGESAVKRAGQMVDVLYASDRVEAESKFVPLKWSDLEEHMKNGLTAMLIAVECGGGSANQQRNASSETLPHRMLRFIRQALDRRPPGAPPPSREFVMLCSKHTDEDIRRWFQQRSAVPSIPMKDLAVEFLCRQYRFFPF